MEGETFFDRASCAACSKLALFVAEATFSQVGDTHDHASFLIEWQVFEIEAAVEVSHRLVERVGEDAEASDVGRQSHRSAKRKEEKRTSAATTLKANIHGKLAKQNYGDWIRAIALRRLWRICPLDLAGAEGDIGGNETVCGIAYDAGA